MELLRTPLHGEHKARGAKMIPFDGFDMPVQYTSIIEEHLAVRHQAGIFDVSHMGEIELRGRDALRLTDYLVTNSVIDMRDGDVKYSPMCYPSGGEVDDIFIYRRSEEDILLVVNASPGWSSKDFGWIREHCEGFEVTVVNRSRDYGEVALQGPASASILDPLLAAPVAATQLKRFTFANGTLFGRPVLVSRTGYTGEDGFEIYSSADDVAGIWTGLLESGKAHGIRPCGLGARDTLRFEVCYWLYGNDIDENTNPIETGQGWTIKFDKPDFIGRQALLEVRKKGLTRRLSGLRVHQGGIARNGMRVKKEGRVVGFVTSGNYCPSLKQVYAMAMVELPFSNTGNHLTIAIRDRDAPADVVDMPFVTPFNKR